MRLTDILKSEDIKAPLAAKTKGEAIAELVHLLAEQNELPNPQKVLDAVMEREATRTTGVGSGLAIPHGKCAGLEHLVMAVGKTSEPIDFQSIDGRPVTLIWLLASPPEKTKLHIDALARISRMMMIAEFRQALAQANDPEAVFEVIRRQDQSM
jgi:fructose-specific phosphotransferase system IIA component